MLSSVTSNTSFIFLFSLTVVVYAILFASNAQDSSLVSVSQFFSKFTKYILIDLEKIQNQSVALNFEYSKDVF